VDLLSSLLAGLTNIASATLTTGISSGRAGNAHPSIAPYETFESADRAVAVAVGNDRQFAALCDVVGLPALATDPRFADNPSRVAHRAQLHAVLEERLRARPALDWQERLVAARVPAGVVNTVADAFALAESLGLDVVTGTPGGGRQAANPIRLQASPPAYRTPPPPLDPESAPEWLDAPPLHQEEGTR
jgi:crotonobetainyl-CoA:carnitine CoA-transferase CaiB-like acyl-CoA transferase